MKISSKTWIEIVKLISTFIIGLITALAVQSCSTTWSVFWKNQNSTQTSDQDSRTEVDSLNINVKPLKK